MCMYTFLGKGVKTATDFAVFSKGYNYSSTIATGDQIKYACN